MTKYTFFFFGYVINFIDVVGLSFEHYYVNSDVTGTIVLLGVKRLIRD